MAKKSFILYNDQKEVIDELNDEQAGKLFKAIYEYNVNQKETLTGILKLVFIPFKTSFDRDEEKWEEIIEKRSEAGKKHTGNQYTRKKEKEIGTNGTSVPKMEQNGTNGTVSVSDSVSVNDNVNVNVNDSVSVSVNNKPLTNRPHYHTEILNYCLLKFKGYDKMELEKIAEKIFNHYEKTNWKGVGDWKERVELWVSNDIKDGKLKKLPEWFGKEIKQEEVEWTDEERREFEEFEKELQSLSQK